MDQMTWARLTLALEQLEKSAVGLHKAWEATKFTYGWEADQTRTARERSDQVHMAIRSVRQALGLEG